MASQQEALADRSLDYLVGAREDRRRDGEAEGLRGLSVHQQLEPGRLHDRQFRGPRPFENSAGIGTREVPSVRDAGSIANQAAAGDGLAGGIHGRDAMLRCQGNKLFGTLEQEWIRADQKQPCVLLDDRYEGRFEITIARSGSR